MAQIETQRRLFLFTKNGICHCSRMCCMRVTNARPHQLSNPKLATRTTSKPCPHKTDAFFLTYTAIGASFAFICCVMDCGYGQILSCPTGICSNRLNTTISSTGISIWEPAICTWQQQQHLADTEANCHLGSTKQFENH